jgi:hypothetical protein
MTNIFIRPAKVSELDAITKLRMGAFGVNAVTQALFPDAARRAVDFPAWRIMAVKDTFADPGRHTIVAVERQEDGTEEIAGSAEWLAPGGPEPDTPAEELAAKKAKRIKKWPTSLNLEVMAVIDKVTSDAVKAGLEKAGLPEDADKNMWGEFSLQTPCHRSSRDPRLNCLLTAIDGADYRSQLPRS